MAGMGPAPAENKRRRNKKTAVELPAEGNRARFPRLPRKYKTDDGDVTFLKSARDWYEAWARSPMAVQFTGVDWQRLQRVARVVDRYDRDPDPRLLAELRQQEAAFGGSPLDRRRLGVKIGPAGEATDSGQRGRGRQRPSARRARLSVVK